MGKSWKPKHTDASFFVYTHGQKALKFKSETDRSPRIKHTQKGMISMVADKKGYHACQFVITLGDDEGQMSYLDQCGHSPFGEIVDEGGSFGTLDKINASMVDDDDRPYDDVRISRVHVLHDPFPDPEDTNPPNLFTLPPPFPTKKLLKDYRMPKNVSGFEEMDLEDIDDDYEEKRDANQRAVMLEMIGDLPDKDVAPDANVLFVCKLNPVTQDDDLEIIFSRFGEIKSCDIIRDVKTGDSMQYAFIEFERVDDCEKAYLKMDNVLIDERRIHVDFSQSVSKQWREWRKNGKYMNKRAVETENYLGELEKTDDPKWEEKKVTYTNTWAQKAKTENKMKTENVGDRDRHLGRERRNSGNSGNHREAHEILSSRKRNNSGSYSARQGLSSTPTAQPKNTGSTTCDRCDKERSRCQCDGHKHNPFAGREIKSYSNSGGMNDRWRNRNSRR